MENSCREHSLAEVEIIERGLSPTYEEMASMIGTTVETLARLATELKNERIIEQDGKTILIIDEEKLISYANI